MHCSSCGGSSEVKETRETRVGVRRRRECLECHVRWTTVEIRYEGRSPAAVLSDTQMSAFRDVVDQMREFVDAIDPAIVTPIEADDRAVVSTGGVEAAA